MVYALNYQRPAYVSSTTSLSSRGSLDSRNVVLPGGIPEALSFCKIISGATAPPCTLRDFMNYLLYVEFSAENLQFYLWLKDYVKRFNALPDSEKALAKPVELARQDSISMARQDSISKAATRDQKRSAAFPALPTDRKVAGIADTTKLANPFMDDFGDEKAGGLRSEKSSLDINGKDYQTTAADAYDAADIKFKPFTIQPYREEVSRIVAIYISDGAPRQLNLSFKERAELLRNLAITTHPSAFLPVLQTVEWTLKYQAHPNFIRWTICNASRPRQLFAHGLGIFFILVGIAVMAPLAATRLPRAWRVFGALPMLFGFVTTLAAWKGLCVILYGTHNRHLRPWELFYDNDEAALQDELSRGLWSAPPTNLSYEDQPWVVQYKKRSTIRKTFDMEIWIQEPALRRIQDTIFVQSLLMAVFLTMAVVGVFVAIPPKN